MVVRVGCYSGYREDERPVRFEPTATSTVSKKSWLSGAARMQPTSKFGLMRETLTSCGGLHPTTRSLEFGVLPAKLTGRLKTGERAKSPGAASLSAKVLLEQFKRADGSHYRSQRPEILAPR